MNRLQSIHFFLTQCLYISGPNGKDGNQSLLVNHTQYPVYLWHPFRKHSYFCCENEEKQQGFGAALHACIRHLNYGRTMNETTITRK